MNLRTVAVLGCVVIFGCSFAGGCKPEETVEKRPAREVAGVGSGKRGRKIEKRKGVGKILVTPAVSYFRTKEKIVFEIMIPKNMQLFQATNGYYPKSHDEFMKEIIESGLIRLPELPEGSSYLYDPETHQLMVESK